MRIGRCASCERRKVYLEKDGKCLECLKQEGDEDSVAVIRLDVCNIEYERARDCITEALERKGYVRIQHDKEENLNSTYICDLDIHKSGIKFHGGPISRSEYHVGDYSADNVDKQLVLALEDAYSDLLDAMFG